MYIGKRSMAALLCGLALGSGSALAGPASTVNVLLQDPSAGNGITTMQIVATPNTAPAGKVTFRVTNQSTGLVHEMLLLKPASRTLPYDDKTQRVIESKTVKLVDSDDIKPGASMTATATLRPGKYLMICNQPTHYASRMEAIFTVTP
jgi:uncharacterized cupredoxin-like copper-binding protein